MANLLNDLIAIEENCAKLFNKRDLDELLKNFSENISGFSSTEHDRFQGQAELKKTFEYYLAEADNVTFEIMNPVATDLNEIAILSFYWRVTLLHGNKRVEIPGRGTHVYLKKNGTWKIIHEHFSRAH
jgi:ketosteroid isomerase-like protein